MLKHAKTYLRLYVIFILLALKCIQRADFIRFKYCPRSRFTTSECRHNLRLTALWRHLVAIIMTDRWRINADGDVIVHSVTSGTVAITDSINRDVYVPDRSMLQGLSARCCVNLDVYVPDRCMLQGLSARCCVNLDVYGPDRCMLQGLSARCCVNLATVRR